MKKPTRKRTFQMSALIGSLAAAGTTGYLANQPPPLDDKQIIDGLLRRVEDERFRARVHEVGRARGLIEDAETPPTQAAMGSGPVWWRPLPADADRCPVTGVEGIRVPPIDAASTSPPWDQTYMWIHPTDPTIRWAHWTGRPANADPARNGINYVLGPGRTWVAFPYREVWGSGTWPSAVDDRHYRRPLTAEERALLTEEGP